MVGFTYVTAAMSRMTATFPVLAKPFSGLGCELGGKDERFDKKSSRVAVINPACILWPRSWVIRGPGRSG